MTHSGVPGSNCLCSSSAVDHETWAHGLSLLPWVSVDKHREDSGEDKALLTILLLLPPPSVSPISSSSGTSFPQPGECAWLYSVHPPALTQEQVCGLCGNFDGIQNNDFTSSSLQVEEDPINFGNSWKVSPQCADTRKVHLGSVWMEGPLILMGAVVVGTIGNIRAWNRVSCVLLGWVPSARQSDVWPLSCSLLFSAVARCFPCHLSQQHHETDDGGLSLQNPYQRRLPGLQQAGEALWVEGGKMIQRLVHALSVGVQCEH